MKRLLTFITALFLLVSLNGQILRYSNYTAPTSPEEGYTTQFQAVLDEFTWSYGTDTLGWMNDMVYSLDSAGYWDGFMELFYVHTVNQTSDANINWVNPSIYYLTDPGSTAPPFVKYQGYDPAGSDYLATGYIPSTNATNISATDVTLGCWLPEDKTGATDAVIGSNGTSYYLQFFPRSAVPSQSARLSNPNITNFGDPAGSIAGSNFVTKTAKDAHAGYVNGSVNGTDATSRTSDLSNTELFLFSNNNNGTANSDYVGMVSIVFVSAGISGPDATNIHNILHRFMTRMGL